MAKIEEGKYYVDGEGFYKCLEIITEEITMKKFAVMAAVMTSYFHVTIYKRSTYVLEACERRMVECNEDDYKYALEQAECFINEMNEYNTKVFKPLWENKDS
jgi:polyphosphate kinase 2 (PPK2 family)